MARPLKAYRETASFEESQPISMAKNMAQWCNDASKIAAYVNNYFGSRRVTRERCEALIEKRRNLRQRNIPDWDVDESEDDLGFTPVAVAPEPTPVAVRHIKPALRLWPKWYRPPSMVTAMPRDTIRLVAEQFGFTVEEVHGLGRSQVLIEARAACIGIFRRRGMSYPAIGRAMQRDHTSIISLHKQLRKIEARNPLVASIMLKFAA